MTTPSNTMEELVGRVEAATGPDRVVAECLARGLHDHVKAIDTEPYESAARAALSPQPTPTDK